MNTKYLLTLAYDGTNYRGFQVQNGTEDVPTVQRTVQDALEHIYGERLAVTGCSRTDAGVHARDFKLTYSIGEKHSKIPVSHIPPAFNTVLPPDIAVLDARCVPEHFHVRHDVWEKEYEYLVHNSRIPDPFLAGRAYLCKYPIDAERMSEAAQVFLGTHDFRGFMASGSDMEDTVRTVRSVSVTRNGTTVAFRIAADGFLYNMVRIFVGTMLGCAGGRFRAEDLSDILASRDRSRAGMTVPAYGLYLNRVTFREDAFSEAPEKATKETSKTDDGKEE